MITNFYSILDYTAPPTFQVNEQDNDHKEVVNIIKDFKHGVLDGSNPSAVVDSRATLSIGTKRDRKRNAFIATGR